MAEVFLSPLMHEIEVNIRGPRVQAQTRGIAQDQDMLSALKADGLTVICVTHHDHWFHVADRVLAVSAGRLVERAG